LHSLPRAFLSPAPSTTSLRSPLPPSTQPDIEEIEEADFLAKLAAEEAAAALAAGQPAVVDDWLGDDGSSPPPLRSEVR